MAEHIINLGDIQARCAAGKISVEQAFDELFEHVPDKKDEAFSFDILAEGSRNDKVRDVIGDNCAKIRNMLRDFAKAANPRLSEHCLDGAEEFILACLFGLNHSSLSRPKLAARDASHSAAAMMVTALRCLA